MLKPIIAIAAFSGLFVSLVPTAAEASGQCQNDNQCKDGKSKTIDWCWQGECEHVFRDEHDCKSDNFDFCHKDSDCKDGNGKTLDWCFEGECYNAPKDNGGFCEKFDCDHDNDCKDGDSFTVDWCWQGDCFHVDRDEHECENHNFDHCSKDSHCKDGNPETVDWCFEGECYNAHKDDGGACF
jgi:hypothetical protein